MNNLSGVSLLRVLPAAHRPTSKLPLPAAERAGGGPAEMTARSLARRLALVLHDLGLVGVVPGGWVSVEGGAIRFADLDVPTADHLVCHLEDIAAQVADTTDATASAQRTPGAGQAALFDRVER